MSEILRQIFTPENGIEFKTQVEFDSMIEESKDIDDKRREKYPSADNLHDAKAKKTHSDPIIQAEGVAQEEIYYSECLQVKLDLPKE